MKIETNKLFKRQKIEIKSNRLQVKKKTLIKYLEYEISLDNIDTQKTVQIEYNRDLFAVGVLGLILGGIFGAIGSSIFLVIWLGISILLIITGLSTKRRSIIINNFSSDPIILDFNKTNESKIREFADLIISSTKDYLIKKHSRIDKDLPIDNQLDSIDFLRSKDLITEEKFEKLKNKLLGKNSGEKTVGFD